MNIPQLSAKAFLILGAIGCVLQPAHSICQSGISATEQASVKVAPDEATLIFSVESQDVDPDVAFQKNTEDLAKIKDFLRKEHVGSLDVDPPIVETRYTQSYNANALSRTLAGYNVRTTLTASLKDLSKLKVVAAGAIGHGVTNIIGIQLRSSQYEKARADARRQALNKAKARAVELAQQVGQSGGFITDVGEVSQLPQQPWSTYNMLSTMQNQGYVSASLANLTPYGTGLPADAAIESNKIVATSSMYLCMEFNDSPSREKSTKK